MRIIARMNVGGPAVQISGLIRGLDPKEFDHRLYTGFCSAEEADYLEIAAFNITATRIDGLGRRISLGKDLTALLSIISEIRKFRPHIIHTHTAKAGFLGRIASILSLHSSIRVHTFHGHLLVGYFGPLERRLVIIAERFLARFTHHLLAVGQKVREDLLAEKIGKFEKFSVMSPGLEIGQLPNRAMTRKGYNLSASKIHCAFIGRVTNIKRPDRFLDVVSEIKRRGIPLDFYIAGDGPLLDFCRERILREQLPVAVLGWQSDIDKVLAAADIVVLTSDSEGTPLSLIQAGMAAVPAVATRVGSVPEVILDGMTGIITNLDIVEIANALEKLATDKSLRNRMGQAAKAFTLNHFSTKHFVDSHVDLYRGLLSNQAKF
jgi:glycosyltransferase involved in cell wall biosynthesis